MKTVTVDHNPELTLQGAMAVISRHFGGRYHMRQLDMMMAKWIIVEKTPFTAARVRLKRTRNRTYFEIQGYYGSLVAAFSIFLMSWLWLWPGWRRMEEEVASFLETAPEFETAEVKIAPEFKPAESQGTGETPVMVIENAIRDVVFRGIVGDFFLTSRGLYYVPYDDFQKTAGIATIVGGPLVGLGISHSDRQTLEYALSSAAESRKSSYGLSMQERTPERTPWNLLADEAVSIQKDDIAMLAVTEDRKTIIFRDIHGKSTQLNVAKLDRRQAEIILDYLGNPAPATDPAQAARYGFGLPYPSPARLVETLRNGIMPNPESIRGIETYSTYMSTLYNLLNHLPKNDRAVAWRTITRMKSPMGERLSEIAGKGRKGKARGGSSAPKANPVREEPCAHCGAKMPDDAKFCEQCGAKRPDDPLQ